MLRQQLHRWLAIGILSVIAMQSVRAQPAPASETFSRQAMLRDLAKDVIAPGYVNLAAQCRDLTNAIGQFIADKNQTSLDRARKAWLSATEAADRLRCFQIGPIADRDDVTTFYFWQVLPNEIESTVNDPSQAMNQSLLDNAGSTVKGLYALEYLLFDRRGGQATEPKAPAKALDLFCASSRRCDYLAALANDVNGKASQLASDWTATGSQSAAAKFVAGGQENVNRLVNGMAQSIEGTIQYHLNLALVLPPPVVHQLYRLEGNRSGISLKGVVATLEGLDALYHGRAGFGLEDAVKGLNPALAARVQGQFAAAIAATSAVGEPLEQAIVDRRPALQNALGQMHVLEISFKVDLASALGVTLTFTSGDGD
jgi:uncharacterized protein